MKAIIILVLLCSTFSFCESQSFVCNLNPERGPCLAYMIKYFYNPWRGSCEPFEYGGCGGNGNNFRTEMECYQTCKCGENQHYEPCGTACPLTCESYINPPRACIPMCIPGCQCDEGYVRTQDGRCVRPGECWISAAQCGENQHYESCGTSCPRTCENYSNPPQACILLCKPGCQCDEGYVRTQDGRCVRPEECSVSAAQCGEYQHYESCGTACPLTCENYINPPRACILMCNPGCHCDEGYVRTQDGRCVRPEECWISAVCKKKYTGFPVYNK